MSKTRIDCGNDYAEQHGSGDGARYDSHDIATAALALSALVLIVTHGLTLYAMHRIWVIQGLLGIIPERVQLPVLISHKITSVLMPHKISSVLISHKISNDPW